MLHSVKLKTRKPVCCIESKRTVSLGIYSDNTKGNKNCARIHVQMYISTISCISLEEWPNILWSSRKLRMLSSLRFNNLKHSRTTLNT